MMTDWADEKAKEIAHEIQWEDPLGAHQYGIIAKALRDERKRCISILEKMAAEYGWQMSLHVMDGYPLPTGKMCDDLLKIINIIRNQSDD